MAEVHTVYLVPGFFGFVNFGQMVYFAHVREFLEVAFDLLGLPVTVHRVRTSPTASIRRRSADLLEYMAATAPSSGPIHLIGHSTGGLDARLFATPGVSLPAGMAPEPFAARLRSVVTVATPHYGTPIASFFTGLLGQRLLQLLSVATAYVLRYGRMPVRLVVRMSALLAQLRLPLWGSPTQVETIVDQLSAELLGELGDIQRHRFAEFFRLVGADTALLPQLGPEGIDLFNAATYDRPGVRYGCVVTRARPPGMRARLAVGRNPYKQATYTLYEAIYRLAARMPPNRFPPLDPPQRAGLSKAYGSVPTATDNDGIVPTLSQVRGELIHAALADHLDVVGHFADPRHIPPHIDWLTTGSGFGRPHFEALWTEVARFVQGAAAGPAAAAPG